MTTNFEQVRSIFMAVLDRPAEAWEAYLGEACGADAALRQQVESLLEAHRHGVGLLDNAPPAAAATLAGASGEQAGTVIAGRYKLVEPIGEGGMGSVWLAQQSSPVKRKVALKLIKRGMDSRQVLNRFEAERQALAMMDHPNIAKALDGGLTEDGRPFFVMELVRGTPITQYCDACKLSLKERLELFVPVCQAIQHAHQKGIIHRDIKPSNVMIALYDDKPVPKVIDFGVAKATGQSLSAETLNTAFGGVIGTPQYMSPEQATMNNLDIDTRSDVYSLGVLLYELLTGSPPFTRQELEKKGLMEMLRVVREDEPPKPSTRLSTAAALPTLAANRSIEPRRLTKMLRSELDWIVLKALEKNRARRYATANELSADVQQYLCGEPVAANPPSAGYRMKKFVRRHKGRVIAASMVLLALLAGIAGTSFGLIKANRFADGQRVAKQDANNRLAQVVVERDAKDVALKEAEAISTFLVAVFESPDPARDGRTIRVVELLDQAARRVETGLAGQPAFRATLQITLGDTYSALGLARQAIPLHERAREYYRVTFGPEHPDTLVAMMHLADSYFDAGRRPEALKLREDVLALSRKVNGPDHNFTHATMANLAGSYYTAGRRDEAIKLQEDVLVLYRKTRGPEDPDTISLMGNLAFFYSETGRRDEALKLGELVLPLSRKVNGPEHPDTLDAMLSLAAFYGDARRNAEAITLEEQVLPLSRKVNGPEHPDTLRAMRNLALSYDEAGRRDEALKLLMDALPLHRKVNGAEHPETLRAMRNLALTLSSTGRRAEAIKLEEEVLTLSRKVNGPEHPDTFSAMRNLAISYDDDGRKGEAIEMEEQVLTLSRKVNGPEHPDTLEAMRNLAISYDDDGRQDDAIKLELVLVTSRKLYGPEHPDTLEAMRYLAESYSKAGRWNEAIKLLEEVLPLSRKVNGPEHAETLLAMGNLADCYFHAGRQGEAIKLLEELLPLSRKVNGADHPETLTATNNLAWYLATCPDTALRNPNRAVELAAQAVKSAPENPDFLSTLGTAQYRTGEYAAAAASLEKALSLRKDGLAAEGFFLAMARWQLGDKQRARQDYDRAALWMEKDTNKGDQEWRFKEEAAALLKGK